MDFESDIRMIRKVSRMGLVNPMYDRLRMNEAADHMELLYKNNRSLGAALALLMGFIERHMPEIGMDQASMEEAAAMILAVQLALDIEGKRTLQSGEKVDVALVLQGDDSGHLDSTQAVLVETTYQKDGTRLIEAYHPVTEEDDERWNSTTERSTADPSVYSGGSAGTHERPGRARGIEDHFADRADAQRRVRATQGNSEDDSGTPARDGLHENVDDAGASGASEAATRTARPNHPRKASRPKRS